MATNNFQDFSAQLKKFTERTNAKAERRLKRICLKAFQNIVQRTPVLTGCARGNWRINFGPTPLRTFTSETTDPNGASTISSGSTAILGSAQIGTRVNMVNSTPYIQRLEHGYSRQAPEGMVHITVEEISAAEGLTVQW